MENDNENACPTQAGTTTAYIVEYQNDDDIWKKLETVDVPAPIGVPTGGFTPGIFKMFGFFSYSSAMALAWHYIANEGNLSFKRVRIVPYKVKYDIKAWRQEEDFIEVGGDIKEKIKRKL